MKIVIKSIEVLMFLGIYKKEKEIQTKVLIDVEIEVKNINLVKQNNLLHLVDYDEVATKIKNYFDGSNYDLIEDLIFDIHHLIKFEESVSKSIKIRVFKFGTHPFVSHICIEKEFSDFA